MIRLQKFIKHGTYGEAIGTRRLNLRVGKPTCPASRPELTVAPQIFFVSP
jgi:hypothetical protein